MARAASLLLMCSGANVAAQRQPTTQTSIGVFYLPGAPRIDNLWREGDKGSRLFLRGRVLSAAGEAVPDALVELWHADARGGVDESRYRSSQVTAADGSFGIKTILPGHIERALDYPVFAPRHIHVVIRHPGFVPLVSLIYFKGDERLHMAPYPELAIVLEETHGEDDSSLPGVDVAEDDVEVLFGRVELILRDAE